MSGINLRVARQAAAIFRTKGQTQAESLLKVLRTSDSKDHRTLAAALAVKKQLAV